MKHGDKLKFSIIHNQTKKEMIYSGTIYELDNNLMFIDDIIPFHYGLDKLMELKSFKIL